LHPSAEYFAAANIVRVGILLPLSGSWPKGDQRGRTIAGAAMLAVQDVNSDLSLLDGKVLEYSGEDSGCGSLESMAATNKILLRNGQLDAMIGPACSSACESSAYLLRDRAIPQISFGCTESSLAKNFPMVCNLGPHLIV
jgi:ABC-type branched-subunit amino acid transport system substrate-binding protein